MNSITKPDDDWSKFVLSIFKLNGLIMKAGEDIARPVGQSSARWQVLGRVFEPQTVAKMARDMGHARQGVQRVADVLVKEGLIVYKNYPTDRRTKLLKLTPKGLDVLKAIYARQMKWSQHLITKLESGQLVKISAALEAVGEILESNSQEEVSNK
jgi:DNA-binding MarR family transcriptional regulator